MGLASHLMPRPIRRRYIGLIRRLHHVEAAVRHLDTAVDTLILNPRYVPDVSTGFNGQIQRKRIFADVIEAIAADAIVETGTWLGDTTAYMAETSGLPVYSCEVSPRFHGLAQMRLTDMSGINLELSDSRAFLKELSSGPITGLTVFFYLDAHWYDDLPLREEISCIAGHWSRFAVMIDDFNVPDDPGYGYDDYGSGKALALEYLGEVASNLTVFFPAAPSHVETGRRRGCAVLAPGGAARRLESVKSLRLWDRPPSSD